MIKYKNLTIIGTSHISKQSVKEIKSFIETELPEIVAVELDKARLIQLMSENEEKASLRSSFRVGLAGFAFAMIGRYAQKKLGDVVGMKPGSDMKSAITLANKHKLKVALIDQNIAITLKKFSKAFGFKDIWQAVKDFILAIFQKKEDLIRFDIRKVPSEKVIEELIGELQSKYPSIYDVLVHQRNKFMAKKLLHIVQKEPDKKILAVVGAGHVKGISEILHAFKPDYSYSYTYTS